MNGPEYIYISKTECLSCSSPEDRRAKMVLIYDTNKSSLDCVGTSSISHVRVLDASLRRCTLLTSVRFVFGRGERRKASE